MNPNDPNLPQLQRIAVALGELREQLVFVGGSVAGLLLTDPLAEGVRATTDVDAIASAGRAAGTLVSTSGTCAAGPPR